MIKINKDKVVLRKMNKLYADDIEKYVKYIWDNKCGLGKVEKINISYRRTRATISIETDKYTKKFVQSFYDEKINNTTKYFFSSYFGETVHYWWSDINDFLHDFRESVKRVQELKNSYYENFVKKQEEETLNKMLDMIKNEIPEHFL